MENGEIPVADKYKVSFGPRGAETACHMNFVGAFTSRNVSHSFQKDLKKILNWMEVPIRPPTYVHDHVLGAMSKMQDL